MMLQLRRAAAALQVGPVDRNLAGARRASELIVAGLSKHSRISYSV
ncbi:MAG: hypothetical protein DSM107014_05510 [Gomphosphaeria aponina SAG 52.96 = DSM 107014]|uniref:Uncharacterized protein n=1 Tax=Gomphosphaeria aponina SAG 52.96 = DSM 107014 TaxID=1521640 RepID=A0A941JST7_9CHRO|nr:hypothetical protein [Gomphosphaeria aponina SAG 52.96 = DSM 107014]